MKKRTFVLANLIYSLALLLPHTILLADQVVPPTAEALVGAWIGYEDGCLYFYRFVLATNGKGTCSTLFNDETPDAYLIESWRIADGELSLKLSPKTKNAEAIAIKVINFDALRMDIVVSGVTNKWQRNAIVFNEREFLKRAKKTAR